jgi:DNA gyrase subunit B
LSNENNQPEEELMETDGASASRTYNAENIQVLKGLEGVRHRPAMYIGSTSESGLHHLVYELVDNAIDEVMAGHANKVSVTLHKDGSCSVEDNGRGIPVDIMAEEGRPAIEVILTTLHSGGKFDGSNYKVSGGLHGVGSSVVCALSNRFTAEVYRDGQIHFVELERGLLTKPTVVTGKTKKNGSLVRFWPDDTIFETTEFKSTILEERLRELSYLNAGTEIILTDEDEDEPEERVKRFKARGGLSEFIKYLNRAHNAQQLISPVIHYSGEVENTRVEIALQWTSSYKERINGYANNIFTKDGGTHIIGLKKAVTRVISTYAKNKDMLKGKEQLTGEDIREGLTGICSVWITEPQFEGQTKGALGNSEVAGHVEKVIGEEFNQFLNENPGVGRKIVERATAASRAREAAKRARDIERKKAGLSSSLPGKLTDCSDRNPENCELFIVEGNSAAGPAKGARNRNFQAILPIRGKILNVERAGLHKVLQNEEVRSLIAAIGTNIVPNFNLEKLRYHKIVMLTDADVDGAHIRTLLMTFFFNFMPELIENGHLFIALNPLFRIRKGKSKQKYVFTEDERDAAVAEFGGNCEVTRFKGLGEMDDEELWNTSMDPEARTLMQVNIEDMLHAEQVIVRLMGNEVQPRKKFITEYAREVKNLDI